MITIILLTISLIANLVALYYHTESIKNHKDVYKFKDQHIQIKADLVEAQEIIIESYKREIELRAKQQALTIASFYYSFDEYKKIIPNTTIDDFTIFVTSTIKKEIENLSQEEPK